MNRKLSSMGIRGMGLIAVIVVMLTPFGIASTMENWQPEIQNSESLTDLLAEARELYNQPAVAAALVYGDSIIAEATIGSIVYGEEKIVNEKSRFHIGSTTKSMTAVLVAMLVSEGKLTYDMTLEQALHDIPMRDEYRNATIHDLLCNKAGIIAFQMTTLEDPGVVEKLTKEIPKAYPDPTDQRREVTKLALSLEPIAEPGTKVIYSNVGWPIIGYIIEQATGQSYEKLLQERIFKPLRMNTAKIGGWPASLSDPDQPRGHYIDPENKAEPTPQELDDEYVLSSWMNPSGGVHCSIHDYALYAREHLAGLQGRGKLLTQSEYETLHTIHVRTNIRDMYPHMKIDREAMFGYGWGIAEKDYGDLSLGAGSGGTFFAQIYVYPALNFAFVGFTNCGTGAPALRDTYQKVTGLD
ncbi:MAG: beta-lactamase family protein [candidate division WOR-3 bacterium]|nr:MAG: beta-lactamase family protein [candidate division WOR-3 bacterium]